MLREETGVEITHALKEVAFPAYVIDRSGRIRWLNRGAMEMVGDMVGQSFSQVVAPEDLHLARTEFTRKLIGDAEATEYMLTLLGVDGRRVSVRISSVPLVENSEVVGVFGVACAHCAAPPRSSALARSAAPTALTPRQYETLCLLATGHGTDAIAERLGVATETARNHIRNVLRKLDAHSRLEAVVRGHQLGLLDQ
jgi:PAS domain S-box-containing protein